MLRTSLVNQIKATQRLPRLKHRIAALQSQHNYNGNVKQCGSRLIYFLAQNDPALSTLPPSMLVQTVNASLNCVAAGIKKKHLTQSMMRVVLGMSDEPISAARPIVKNFSEEEFRDRNVKFLTPKLKADERDAKVDSFYEMLYKAWPLCAEIEPINERVAVIFRLISVNGYQENYSEKQIEEARSYIETKSSRYLRTFAYSSYREFYCRRRLITDGSLHQILSTGERHDIRKVAWILFFDSNFQRFPRRPKKDPTFDMLELWTQWQDDEAARAMPFMERFVALLTHPNLAKMIQEAQKTSDAKARAIVDRNDALFAYRCRTALQVGRYPYDARLKMNRKGATLHSLSWKLQKQRMQSERLSAKSSYESVLETSKSYRTPTDYNKLKAAHNEAMDDGFVYQGGQY